MKKNELYTIATGLVNSILINGFDCEEASKMSDSGIQFMESIDMYSMIFSVNDSLIGPSEYSAIITGDYSLFNSKFYPFFIIVQDNKDKSRYLKIDIQKLIISMVDMDNKYNSIDDVEIQVKSNKILKYELITIDEENYIGISLTGFNIDKVISKAINEGIEWNYNKFDEVYKNNMILISEDSNSGVFRVKHINFRNIEVIFESSDIHKFYKFLESSLLKTLLSKNSTKKLSQKDIKKNRAIKIENMVNQLLEESVYKLEEETIQIQTEELVKASDLLFEQYEYNYEILDELNKVLVDESTLDNVAKIVSKGLGKKLDCYNFLNEKTYLYKPRDYMEFVFENLKVNATYDSIDENIRSHVKAKFLYELDSYKNNVIVPQLINQSSIFIKEIDDLNKIVDEIQDLIERIKSNRIKKREALNIVKVKKDKINKYRGFKLKSTYKQLHKFAAKLGFIKSRQNSTSHLVYKRESISVPIPNKKGDVKTGLLLTIIKQLGSNRDDFYNFIMKEKN